MGHNVVIVIKNSNSILHLMAQTLYDSIYCSVAANLHKNLLAFAKFF